MDRIGGYGERDGKADSGIGRILPGPDPGFIHSILAGDSAQANVDPGFNSLVHICLGLVVLSQYGVECVVGIGHIENPLQIAL